MSIKSDIGRSLLEGRLEHLRDEERRDANALAALRRRRLAHRAAHAHACGRTVGVRRDHPRRGQTMSLHAHEVELGAVAMLHRGQG